ncbi:MAG: hypothetical protein RQ838_03585 [Caldivirga sp.]|jgi:hypothetical protein|nr:hypothetical protein [Caldivirga sp.]
MSLSLTTTATILGLAKRPGMTKDGRAVLSLTAEINGTTYEVNLVSKPGQGIEDALTYLANAGYITKANDKFTLQVPTWAVAKARNGVVWVHVEDYERLKGAV